jgi:regulatory protein
MELVPDSHDGRVGPDEPEGLAPDPGDGLQHALGIAWKYLNRRDRTVAEMRRHLDRAAIGEADIEQAIATLTGEGYLDDARFARLFAEDKRALEHWGSERIERSLFARGVDADVVRETIAGATHESELDRALSLLRRRFPAAPGNRRDRDRALGVLLRKGYDSELALDALAAHSREAA